MAIKRLYWKTAGAAVTAGILGALAGILNGFLFMGEQEQPSALELILPFQNFSLLLGAVVGFLVGAAAALVFVCLARKRYQFPGSTRIGTRLGILAAAVVTVMTGLVVYLAAPHFSFNRGSFVGFVVQSVISVLLFSLYGLVAGWTLAETGARDLSYWD
jgi:hypothetical protein